MHSLFHQSFCLRSRLLLIARMCLWQLLAQAQTMQYQENLHPPSIGKSSTENCSFSLETFLVAADPNQQFSCPGIFCWRPHIISLDGWKCPSWSPTRLRCPLIGRIAWSTVPIENMLTGTPR